MAPTLSRLLIFFTLPGVLLLSCTRHAAQIKKPVTITGPRCLVYKTKNDYRQYVPVILSADKTKIVSYPGIGDIYYKAELAYPTLLENGYLLDNRGIGPDVAFLSLTYEGYSKLKAAPGAAELMDMILDNDPLLELYDCGDRSQYPDPVEMLNKLIRSGGLAHQDRLK